MKPEVVAQNGQTTITRHEYVVEVRHAGPPAHLIYMKPEEFRWLVLVGGPAAMHEIEGAIPKISDRANRRCANA